MFWTGEVLVNIAIINIFTRYRVSILPVLCLVFAAVVFAGCNIFTQDEASINGPVPSAGGEILVSGITAEPPWAPESIEENILQNDVIVRATMTSFSSDVVLDSDDQYRAIIKFRLNVSEYLKGSGPSDIVAVAVGGRSYDTRHEAEGRKTILLEQRDAQWDNREAIIFLFQDDTGFGATLDALFQRPDHFLMVFGERFSGDDRYSLHSKWNRSWYPLNTTGGTVGGSSSNDRDKEYLLEPPPLADGVTGTGSVSSASAINLAELRTLIRDLTAELNGGDGSEAYKECVREKYRFERQERGSLAVRGQRSFPNWLEETSLASGQPSGTQLYERQRHGIYPSDKGRTWLEGSGAHLFTVVQGTELTPYDVDGDGRFTAVDGVEFTETFTTARPLPGGEYKIDRKEVWAYFLPCNYVISNDWTVTVTAPAWTVTVTAPAGTLHEAFFDPVVLTSGGVGASGSFGVIDPDEFTVGNDDYEIESIVWDEDDGEVVVTLDDDVSLSGKTLDFIELDGSIGTSLNIADAMVNQTAATWTWNLTSVPWEDGDLLMLRIRETSTGE